MPNRQNPTGAVKALLDEQTREMYDLVEGSARPLAGALQDPKRLVAGALAAFLGKRKPEDPFTQKDYQDALRELRRTPDIQLAHLGAAARTTPLPLWVKPLRERMTDVLKRKARDAGEMAARHAAEQARAMGIVAGVVSAEEVERAGARKLTRRMAAISAEQAEQPYRDIKRRLAMGVALGLTLAELVRGMMRVGGIRGPLPDVQNPLSVANAIADAIFGVASRSARRVAVTEIANAYNVQILIAMDQLEAVTMKRWDSSNDRKVCPDCYAAHGRVVELHQSFPNGSQGPPLHPNCRCCVTVWPSKRPRGAEYDE